VQECVVANTYLRVSFKDKDAAKALGAKWDGEQRQWYVPEGRDLMPFAVWLPAESSNPLASANPVASTPVAFTPTVSSSASLALIAKKGVSLSSLLAGISQAVAKAYSAGVWTLVEVVELRTNGGHVFMGISERDSGGGVLAKANAVIWQSVANSILPVFEQATGAQLAPGIKLLVRARPVFKVLHGFSIEIDAIDPEYTLGDLEARKREIRERLKAEGIFAANKQLDAPWDFRDVLVVAPAGGAGLGDFQVEADRLEKFAVCSFTYVYARFQGEGAAKEICDALQSALTDWRKTHESLPDVIVVIRGGGAVNDMAWLNEYDLARLVCDFQIPVFTGIGHERDSTVLDEVAHTKFDTPSKVILGIQERIAKRAMESKANGDFVFARARQLAHDASAATQEMEGSVRLKSFQCLSMARRESAELIHGFKETSHRIVSTASEMSNGAIRSVQSLALTTLQQAKLQVPHLADQIIQGSRHAVLLSNSDVDAVMEGNLLTVRRIAEEARGEVETGIQSIQTLAAQNIKVAAETSEAMIREISGQGPKKTLQRGFAVVRALGGRTLTRAKQIENGDELEIEFMDGKVTAKTGKAN
jgi:exodeoxyribonuclease VII large subunit